MAALRQLDDVLLAARSCFRRVSIRWRLAVVFFLPLASARLSDSLGIQMPAQQFSASFGDGMPVDPQQGSNCCISRVAQFIGFQARIETPLLFIQQAQHVWRIRTTFGLRLGVGAIWKSGLLHGEVGCNDNEHGFEMD